MSSKTIISYAQNFEDVMLWRALGHIERGFYIDVGACSPDEHSVTKLFSERGWHGINVEPNPVHYEALKSRRPRDVNLPIALGSHEGRTRYTCSATLACQLSMNPSRRVIVKTGKRRHVRSSCVGWPMCGASACHKISQSTSSKSMSKASSERCFSVAIGL